MLYLTATIQVTDPSTAAASPATPVPDSASRSSSLEERACRTLETYRALWPRPTLCIQHLQYRVA